MKPPIIILHQPQLGENIGMCARAMLNCGLDRLRLVNPRDGWPNAAAKATAADADEAAIAADVVPVAEVPQADSPVVVGAVDRVDLEDGEVPEEGR